MKLFKIFFTFFAVLLCLQAQAFLDEEKNFSHPRILSFAPHLANPNYFSFDFGYILTKNLFNTRYQYHAFAKAFLAEEYYTIDPNLRASSMGGKVGLKLPTQKWLPLFIELTIGYGKTSLQEEPWFGWNHQSLARKEIFLAEGGLIYRLKNGIFFKGVYQINNVDYFDKEMMFSIGYNF